MTYITTASQDFDTMTEAELRVAIKQKQGVLNQTFSTNQDLEGSVRRLSAANNALNKRNTDLQRMYDNLARDLSAVVGERDRAWKLGAHFYEKLMVLSQMDSADQDVRSVTALYTRAVREFSRITCWPELNDTQIFEKFFAAAQKDVFDAMVVKPPKKRK